MRQAHHVLGVATRNPGLVEVTADVVAWVEDQPIANGLLTVFCRHTSASILIQENADSDVRSDLEAFFSGLVPEDPTRYAHATEGPDDMPAHIRAALTNVSLSVPVIGSKLALGRWQGIYLFEHRRGDHRREIVLHLLGE